LASPHACGVRTIGDLSCCGVWYVATRNPYCGHPWLLRQPGRCCARCISAPDYRAASVSCQRETLSSPTASGHPISLLAVSNETESIEPTLTISPHPRCVDLLRGGGLQPVTAEYALWTSNPAVIQPRRRRQCESVLRNRKGPGIRSVPMVDAWLITGISRPARPRGTAPRRATRGRKTEAVLARDFLAC
jgi:hypothetical protein